MKVILALVFAYDAADWAHEYDLPEADADADFTAVLRRAADDRGIAQALDASWPMMRGHITVSTLDGLDSTARDDLLHHLKQDRDAGQDTALLAAIRDHLAAHPDDVYHREARWVIFHTDESDDGHFLTGTTATVFLPEGDHVEVDFDGTRVDDLLTHMYGARGRMAALGVDLRTARLEFDDYADNVPERLGIATNDHTDGDGCASYPTDYTVVRDGVEVYVTDLVDGDVFIDYDDPPWLVARVGRVGYDVHVDIKPTHAS